MNDPFHTHGFGRALNTLGAWLLGILWVLPLIYAVWTAFHPAAFAVRFEPLAPLTLENFAKAWQAAPFARYFLNTFMLVTMVLAGQLLLCTLAAYAFARFEFFGRDVLFFLVLLQLMVMPDILIVENYRTMKFLGLIDTITAIGRDGLRAGASGEHQLAQDQLGGDDRQDRLVEDDEETLVH